MCFQDEKIYPIKLFAIVITYQCFFEWNSACWGEWKLSLQAEKRGADIMSFLQNRDASHACNSVY